MKRIGRGTLLLRGSLVGCVIGAAAQVSTRPVSAANDTAPVPQLVYMTRTGLDPANNGIDRLIDIFGFACLRTSINRRACRIEKELVTFLKTFPADRDEIASQLAALGASCKDADERLTCVYERRVEVGAWIVGSSEPETVLDEHFRIELGIAQSGNSLHYDAAFNRVETVKRRRGDPKAN